MFAQNNRKGFVGIALIIIVAIIAAGTGYYYFQQTKKDIGTGQTIAEAVKNNFSTPTPTPIDILFQELTIPYLRNRKYESKIGALNKYADNGTYTAYTTSYDSDGLKINGYLTIPDSGKPADGFPAIVFVHGYIPPTIYQTTKNYVNYVDQLTRAGYVVFKIDLRGHDKSEGDPGGAYYSGDYVIDTLNAYSALQNFEYVNPNKIGLWGHSMAGNVTFRSFVAKKDIPALVIWAGAGYTYNDLLEYRIQDNSYRPPVDDSERQRKRQLLRDTYGEFDPNSDFWKTVPATNYLEGVSGAVQLNHAVDDNVVNIGYSRGLSTILDDSGIPHELKVYNSGGHNLTGATYGQAWQNTISFFDKYLK